MKDSTKNILYRAKDNRIEIRNLPFGAIPSLSSGTIKHDKGREYVANVDIFGRDTLYIKSKGKVIFEKVFDVNRARDYEMLLGDLKTNRATPAQIVANPKIWTGTLCQLKLPTPSYCIVSFSISLLINNNITQPVVVQGDSIPASILEEIRTLHPKDTVFLGDIKAKGADSLIRTLPTMAINIQ